MQRLGQLAVGLDKELDRLGSLIPVDAAVNKCSVEPLASQSFLRPSSPSNATAHAALVYAVLPRPDAPEPAGPSPPYPAVLDGSETDNLPRSKATQHSEQNFLPPKELLSSLQEENEENVEAEDMFKVSALSISVQSDPSLF